MELLPYLIVLLLLTVLLTIGRRNVITLNKSGEVVTKKYSPIGIINVVISYFIFIIFSVFRVIDVGLGGIDALAYKEIFYNAGGNVIESINRQFYEPGYSLIIWFSRTISDDYRVALFIIYTIMFLLIVNFIKQISWSKYTPISIFLLLTIWLSSFNTTRAILALFIGTFVYSLLFKKKYKSAIFIAIIATSIHTAASVLLLMIAVVMIIKNKSRFSPIKLITLILSISVVFFILVNYLNVFIRGTRYEAYIGWQEGELALGTFIIVMICITLSFLRINELSQINQYNRILIIILPVSITIIVLQFNYPIFYRMLLFFLPILYVFIPDLIRAFSIKKRNDLIKFPIKLGLFAYLVFRIYSFLTLEINSVGLPYFNIFFD